MKKPNIEELEKKLEAKKAKRDAKKKPKMKVDGAGVRNLGRLIADKSGEKRNKLKIKS